MHDEIDHRKPGQLRSERESDKQRATCMDRDMGEQRGKPVLRLFLALCHPACLEKEVGHQVLDDEQSRGPDEQLGGDLLRHGRHENSFGLHFCPKIDHSPKRCEAAF